VIFKVPITRANIGKCWNLSMIRNQNDNLPANFHFMLCRPVFFIRCVCSNVATTRN
jgi:hypothetical protein